MNSEDPWHLTVVRTRGLTFLRPEKSWRPIVAVAVTDRGHEHAPQEVVLGCDGQNPNLKTGIVLQDITQSSKLAVQVFHKSQTKKKHRKRNLVGTASVSLQEFLNKHPLPHLRPVEYDVRLTCPPAAHRSPTINKQQQSATLTIRIAVPQPDAGIQVDVESPPLSPIYGSEMHETDGSLLSDGPSCTCLSSRCIYAHRFTIDTCSVSRTRSDTLVNTPDPSGMQTLPETRGLRRRRTKKQAVKGFHLFSDSDGPHPMDESDSESDESIARPATPSDRDTDDSWRYLSASVKDVDDACSPRILPTQFDQASMISMQNSLTFAEACVDRLGPYHDLREAEVEDDVAKAEKVLGRLMTEWYVVGASLLALAGVDVAVFGLAPDSIFAEDVNGFSRQAVTVGAISAAIGFLADVWFIVLYSNANAAKFQRLAKDVYGTYFFFCLTCRLPTLCLFLSALALTAFLFSLAWAAWPTAVLVMSFAAGVLLSSQFLIFGVHRFVNLLVWLVRVAWRALAARTVTVTVTVTDTPSDAPSSAPPAATGVPSASHAQLDRIEMPVPCPSPAPARHGRVDVVFVEHVAAMAG
ncbi:uncharacterized protein BXZ73DRAFT_93239 [Epithele typhae]|uniref:uncharacterized protein n=1 Tax=Epithele typhae TaxID=378194 RepID=UPI0020072188|nr:uncharacterized protein BXZ73DRAFT_93239 [Epithele typhae]KAH9912136.1 hypothetical protein BXZ73DRAFT_93239 [Epithele typhae]